MECPKCGTKMIDGIIPTDTYRIVFRGNKKDSRTKLPPFESALMGPKIPLSGPGFLFQNCTAYYCNVCDIVIIPGPTHSGSNDSKILV